MYISIDEVDGSFNVKMSVDEFKLIHDAVLWVDSGCITSGLRFTPDDVFSSLHSVAQEHQLFV